MKFGLFVNSQQPRGDDPVLRFRQCVQQVIVARDTGFDAIAAGREAKAMSMSPFSSNIWSCM